MPGQMSLPRVVGHRGAAAYAPENTLASIREAHRRGATWVEFDVKLSQEGLPLLMHDASLRRTAGLDRPVAGTSWAKIAGLDAGAWFDRGFTGEKIPSFAQALACAAELAMGINVEIKPCPVREAITAQVVCATLAQHWPAAQPTPLLSSFSEASLAAARSAAPDLPRALLVGAVPADWQRRAEALAVMGINVDGKRLTAPQASAIKSAGYLLSAYTINEGRRARDLLAMGVDCIITDRPDTILAAISS